MTEQDCSVSFPELFTSYGSQKMCPEGDRPGVPPHRVGYVDSIVAEYGEPEELEEGISDEEYNKMYDIDQSD